MLIRITRPRADSIEGVDLKQFEVGKTYDVATALATYLVVMQYAEPVPEEQRAASEPEGSSAGAKREEKIFQGTDWPGWAVAADWLRRK